MENKAWVKIGWKGQRLYLPEYTKVFRDIEQTFTKFLHTLEFQECLFPKLPTLSQSFELKKALPRLTDEWSNELVDAKLDKKIKDYPMEFTLSHWQCEPFYYYLQTVKPKTSVKFFDKSGWSYRVENDINDFRLFEFQRIECVWACSSEQAEQQLDLLINGICQLLICMGLNAKIIQKKNEENDSFEKIVKDIEINIEEIGSIELVGSHLHGRLFIDGLKIDLPTNYYTGCCGIGISRIVNSLFYLKLIE